MGLGTAIAADLKKRVTWKGRATRSEFWGFILSGIFAIIIVLTVGAIVRLDPDFRKMFYPVMLLSVFLPDLPLVVRRLHDTDRSGWWFWIVLVPLVGIVILIAWFCERGTIGRNRYGSDPLNDVVLEPAGSSHPLTGDLDKL